MQGNVITNGEIAVYERGWREEIIPNTKCINYISKKDIITIRTEEKESLVCVNDIKEVLLHKLETILYGSSDIHYEKITKEDRDKAFGRIISEPHRNSQICKKFKVNKIIESMTSITYNNTYFYLNSLTDVIYLIQTLKWVCRDIANKREDFELFRYNDFRAKYSDLKIMNYGS